MRYCYGGFALRSTTEIDQLRPLPGDGSDDDLHLVFPSSAPPFPDHEVEFHGRYRFRIGRAGDRWIFGSMLDGVFVLDPARRTLACHVERPAEDAWQDVLVRRVLPRVASLLGGHAVHAAAVATERGAALLVGRSGAGKSTLTAALGNAGWSVLSDDIAILRTTPAATPAIVAPVHRGVALWAESRAALGLPRSACHVLAGYDGRKFRFSPPDDADPANQPLHALLFLERTTGLTAPEAIAMPAAQAVRIVAQQSVHADPTAPLDARTAASFAQLAAAVRKAPAYRLRYPDDFAALPQVDALVRTLIDRHGPPS